MVALKRECGLGKANGTFGELLQGKLIEDGREFLVTCPISVFSEARFYPYNSCAVKSIPETKLKSRKLASALLSYLGNPPEGTLVITGHLPEGKGLASSSADLVATARAIENAFNAEIPMSLVETLMRDIEPSDGVMHSGIVAYFHKEVRLRNYMGYLSDFCVIGFDEGGVVDTVDYNRRHKEYTLDEQKEYSRLLRLLEQAIIDRDLKVVGQVSTASAIMNQRFNPKTYLYEVVNICQEIDALGVIVAHSGTYIGILISKSDPKYEQIYHSGLLKLGRFGRAVETFQSLRT